MKKRLNALKFAVCIHTGEYAVSLALHKIYRVIPDKDAAEDGDVRIVDDSGEDYLYPAEWFVFVKLPPEVEKSMKRAA